MHRFGKELVKGFPFMEEEVRYRGDTREIYGRYRVVPFMEEEVSPYIVSAQYPYP